MIPCRIPRFLPAAVALAAAAPFTVPAAFAEAGSPAPEAAAAASGDFLPGWEAQAQPLFMMGPGPNAATTKWYVAGILKRGRYVVAEKKQDGGVELLDGYGFDVQDAVDEKIFLMIPMHYGNLVAVPESMVRPRPGKAGGAGPAEGS